MRGQVRHSTHFRSERTATCPTCGETTTFRYVGDQRWPETVAEAAGMPAIVRLWMCNRCSTTLVENDMLF